MDDPNAGKKQLDASLRDQLQRRDSVSRICSPSNADSSRPCSFCCKNGRRAAAGSAAEAISKFPPPLTILAGDCCYSRFPYCMPRGGLRPIRKNGRFLLQEVRVPKQLMFHSVRKNGRLVLLLLLKNDELLKDENGSSSRSSGSTSSSSLSFLDEEQDSSSSSSCSSSCSSGGIPSLEELAPASQGSGGLFTESAQSAFSCDSAASFSEDSQAPVAPPVCAAESAGHLVVAHGIAIVDSITSSNRNCDSAASKPPLSIPNCQSAGRFTIIEGTSIAAQFPYGKPNNSKLPCCTSSSCSSSSSSSSAAAAIVELGNSCGASQWNSTRDFRFQAILPWTH